MIPWEVLGHATVPGEEVPLVLARRGDEFVIRIGPRALMSSRAHGSEEILAERACGRIAGRPEVRVLIGGLGMGFTLAAALRHLRPDARVVVAELIPAVVGWNRVALADLAGRPLEDPRVAVHEGDVAEAIREGEAAFDAILLDVDNGPDGLTRATNDRLYSRAGLGGARRALRPGGVFGLWSVAPDRAFRDRLVEGGFEVEEQVVRARRSKGGRHTLWLAARMDRAAPACSSGPPAPRATRAGSRRAPRSPGAPS